ncbi:MAG: hypothetical protein ABI824_03225 [Acidobacteriota bacterium]
MMDTPLVSVNIGFLRADRAFVPALQSVSGQTSRNWEFLLRYDGSLPGHHAQGEGNEVALVDSRQ